LDEASRAVTTARDQALLAWPWDRPATTIARDDRIPPPGHHSGNAYMSHPNAVVLSEKAAAILQGFPPGWTFAGKTKRARWSQLGQAMPPPLGRGGCACHSRSDAGRARGGRKHETPGGRGRRLKVER